MTEATKPPEGAVAPELPPIPESMEEIGKLLKQDPRANIYKKSDEQKGLLVPPAPEEPQEGEPEEPKANPPPVKGKEEPTGETEEPEGKEKGDTPKVFTRAEFIEHFGDIRIKDKIAGEELDAPVGDWMKATGLEKHFTKRLQKLSEREREALANLPGTTDQPLPVNLPGINEEEIQRRYDELFIESPFKAQQYLRAADVKRQEAQRVLQAQRAERALVDFRGAYPEVTEDEYAKMNTPAFYEKYREVIEARDRGDYFSTLVTAYTRLKQEELEDQRRTLREERDKSEKELAKKADLKKKGQVLRQATKPEPVQKPKQPTTETREDYIRRIVAERREKMGITRREYRPQ